MVVGMPFVGDGMVVVGTVRSCCAVAVSRGAFCCAGAPGRIVACAGDASIVSLLEIGLLAS